MPPLRSSRRHYVFGLSVRPYVPFSWSRYFGVTRSKVKGHRAHYVCKNSSWSRYLKNRLMDSCQTLVMYVSCRADELIRFWGHEVKGQRSQGSLCMQKQLVNRLMDSCIYLEEPMNWLEFGVTRSKVTGLIIYAKTARDRVISRTDWWIPAKLWSCMLLAEPMNWLDFGVMRSKVTRLIMYAKMACDRIIIRTDWWIPAKLRSCMYLAEPMNWVDSWVMRSKVMGSLCMQK